MNIILSRHYNSFLTGKPFKLEKAIIAAVLSCILFLASAGYSNESSKKTSTPNREKTTTISKAITDSDKEPPKPSEQPMLTAERKWEGVISKSRVIAASDRASPEAGYGEKTESEIRREKPRAPRIGALGAMTGELKQYGIEATNGAELASDELDRKGGIRGMEFELLVFDTKGAISGARKGVETFLEYNTLAVVGAATGEVSFAASKMINDNQLIMISAGSRRRLGDTGPYNFRNTLNDTDGIKSLIDYIEKNRNWKNFTLFSSVLNDYSIKLNAIFKSELLKRNLNISHELYLWSTAMTNINEEEKTIAGQMKLLVKNTPDVIVFTGSGKEAVEVIEEMKKNGIHLPLVGAEDLNAPEFTALGERAAGALLYGGFDVNSKNPKVVAFVKAYRKKFGSLPSRLAALSYDSYNLLARAIEKAESMRPSHLRKALLSIKDFHGVTGRTSIGPTGEAEKKAFIFQLKKQGGDYKFVSVQDGF